MAIYELKLMKKKEIVDGKEQFEYESRKLDFVSIKVTRDALKVKAELEKMANEKEPDEVAMLEKQIEFVADVFHVSSDDIWEGLDASTGALKIKHIFEQILGVEELEKEEEKKMAKMMKYMQK
ncbi:phage tail assembly chaperone G [Kurthia populi]|uniref:Phage tail assembly chaperone G n=1 Tax=Kurthia populi TaxID=1562132 RepID=A0ABW5Y3I0_9BACL